MTAARIICLALSLAAASGGAAPPSPHDACDRYPVYHARAATPFDAWSQLGVQSRERTRQWLETYLPLNATLRPYAATEAGAAALASLERASCGAFPSICEELRGLAHCPLCHTLLL